MADRPALQPLTEIGPALRTIAADILAKARAAIADPELSEQDAVHEFRRATKEWRALMRLIAPLYPDAKRWKDEARDHARTLASARDGQAALNAFDDLIDHGVVLSARTSSTIRARIEALRGNEEQSVLTPPRRDAIIAWLDAAAAAVEQWPFDGVDFAAVAAPLTAGYRRARRAVPEEWSLASADDLHQFRQRVVDHRYQMQWIKPLWPRFTRMWIKEAERLRDRLGRCQDIEVLTRLSGVHQPLAHWRARLAPACAERSAIVSQRAARIARRLFAERPNAFRRRLETLWDRDL